MNGVEVYLEGGGDSHDGKARLRQGMTEFLRELRDLRGPRRLRFNVIPCGSRQAAFEAFLHGLATSDRTGSLQLLLVDAEDAITAKPAEHLRQRDRWSFSGVDQDLAHLMARTMETWIVADPQALASYYGDGFHEAALPKHADLEAVSKADVAQALLRATRATTKGEFHKIRHGSDLLARIDPARVRRSCKHCEQFFATVRAKLGVA